uniref:Transportin-3 n=1 Tax=Ascaris suum TaxID=6253 RepID=F1KRX1_ASCSU
MNNIETVYHAIAVLNGQDSSACGKASVWLGEFQKSVYAWTICDRMLAEKRDVNACYFAAQTMRQKLLHSMRELPRIAYTSLRDSLINHISSFECYPIERNGVIIMQLCLTLADLYLQVAEWTDFIAEILDKFTTMAEDKTPVLLNLLKVFPEEIQSRHLRVGENRRRVVNAELARQTHAVLHFLSDVCVKNANDVDVVRRVLNCLSSWLLNPLVPTDELASSQLLQSVYLLLQNSDSPSELHDAACECIVSALYRAEDTEVHRSLALSLQAACYAMIDGFNMAVAHEDCEKLQSYARVFSELNESLLQSMVSTPGVDLGDLKSLEMLLLLAGYHDYSLVEMTFNVWYRLSEFLYERNDDDLIFTFKPYVERYLMALYKHCRFDVDHEGIPDENDDFAEFRMKVSDTIKDVVFIIGTDHCIKNMMSVLQSVADGTWDEMEAALYVISTVVHNVLSTEDTVIPCLVESVLHLPSNVHPAVVFTSIELIGNLVDWLQENKTFQDACVVWLLEKAQSVVFVKVACEALENVCEKCGSVLLPHFEKLLSLIPVLESAPSKGQQMETAALSILRASASLLNGLPGEEIAVRLKLLTEPNAQRLAELISSTSQTSQNGATVEEPNNENGSDSWARLSRDPVLWIDRIAAVFRQVQPWQKQVANPKNSQPKGDAEDVLVPWLDSVNIVWPVLSAVCTKYEKHIRIIEHCCRAVRFLIRSLGVQSIVFVEQLVTQMVDIYGRHPHSCFLYLASILVDEYGQLEHLRSGLVFMLNTLSQGSFKLLQQVNGFRDHPDTIDDLFRLAIRFIQRAPSTFFQEPICENLFECGIVALDVDHTDANRSVTKFFTESIESIINARKVNYRDAGVEGAERLLTRHGAQLVAGCLRAAIFSVTGSLKRDMADVIFTVGKFSQENLSTWLLSALETLPQDGGLCATSEQLQQFHKNVTEAKDLRTVHSQIRDLIRLYM